MLSFSMDVAGFLLSGLEVWAFATKEELKHEGQCTYNVTRITAAVEKQYEYFLLFAVFMHARACSYPGA
jgi:hypothetical protein